jgi:hypothetical protein
MMSTVTLRALRQSQLQGMAAANSGKAVQSPSSETLPLEGISGSAAGDDGFLSLHSGGSSAASKPHAAAATASGPTTSSGRYRKSKYIQDGDSDDSAYNSDGLPIMTHPRTLARERGEKLPPQRRRPSSVAAAPAAAASVGKPSRHDHSPTNASPPSAASPQQYASSSDTDSDPGLLAEATSTNVLFRQMPKPQKRQYLASLKAQKQEIQLVATRHATGMVSKSTKEARQEFWELLAAGKAV